MEREAMRILDGFVEGLESEKGQKRNGKKNSEAKIQLVENVGKKAETIEL